MVGNPAGVISIDPALESQLRRRFGDALRLHVPLAPYTTLKIGGSAEFLLEVHTLEVLTQAIRAASELKISFRFLGGGSNVLIDDEGLRELVVINRCEEISWNDNRTVQVSGGYELDRLVQELSERGWGDLTFAAGIPGSLGGAIVGGAGAFGHLVHESVMEAKVLRRDGTVATVFASDLGIEYRDSQVRRRGDILWSARMGPFRSESPEMLLREISRIKAEREIKHPGPDLPSAGSFFKNLPPPEPGAYRIPAGKLLDEAGVKGMRIGGAGVFAKHANIIVNYGGATAKDVNELADQMAQRVKERFGIRLEREVLYLSDKL